VSAAGDKLLKNISGNAWSTSGASSVEQIAAGADGWVETTVAETTSSRIFGLSDRDVDQNYTTVDYAFYLNAANLLVRVSGSQYTIAGG
jgi:hypothetical protein